MSPVLAAGLPCRRHRRTHSGTRQCADDALLECDPGVAVSLGMIRLTFGAKGSTASSVGAERRCGPVLPATHCLSCSSRSHCWRMSVGFADTPVPGIDSRSLATDLTVGKGRQGLRAKARFPASYQSPWPETDSTAQKTPHTLGVDRFRKLGLLSRTGYWHVQAPIVQVYQSRQGSAPKTHQATPAQDRPGQMRIQARQGVWHQTINVSTRPVKPLIRFSEVLNRAAGGARPD